MPSGIHIMLLYHKNKAISYINFTSLCSILLHGKAGTFNSMKFNTIQLFIKGSCPQQSASKEHNYEANNQRL